MRSVVVDGSLLYVGSVDVCNESTPYPTQRPATITVLVHADLGTVRPLTGCTDELRAKHVKNLVPFEARGMLLLSYWLQPHVVLRVDPRTGRCVHEAQTPGLGFHQRETRNANALHGGTNYVRLDSGVRVAIAHYTHDNPGYPHAFPSYKQVLYAIGDAPPWPVVARSHGFRLPRGDARAINDGRQAPDGVVQFASGLLCSGRQQLLVSYGDNDAKAAFTLLRLPRVLQMMGLPPGASCLPEVAKLANRTSVPKPCRVS